MDKKTIWDLGRDTVEQYRARTKLPVTIVLDYVRSLNNIGAIFRTCDSLCIEQIMLCGITATPPSPEIHKTALGAEDSVIWHYFPTTMECVEHLHSQGYTVCALEQVKGSVDLRNYHPIPHNRYAIIAGHEVNGVDQQVVNAADVCLEIPQFGTKHSLNVSVSTAIAIWHFFTSLSSSLND